MALLRRPCSINGLTDFYRGRQGLAKHILNQKTETFLVELSLGLCGSWFQMSFCSDFSIAASV